MTAPGPRVPSNIGATLRRLFGYLLIRRVVVVGAVLLLLALSLIHI